ncbi:MAG TPA: hypothetical protein VJ827_02350 [Rubrobacter sp.]|nr:hypothetical protein [Rubrobacter sp.]
MTYLDDCFLSEELEETPFPYETFEATLEIGKEPAEPWLADCLGINAFMHDLARLEQDPAPEEAYERYREWPPFVHRNQSFYEALARTSATISASSKAGRES